MEDLITTTARNALDELGLKYDENNSAFDFCIQTEHTNVTVKLACFEEQEVMVVVAFSGVFAPEDKIDSTCRWICDKNMRCVVGNYIIDTNDGEVLFKVSCPLDGKAANKDITKVAVLNVIKRIDDDYLELLKLVYLDNGRIDS